MSYYQPMDFAEDAPSMDNLIGELLSVAVVARKRVVGSARQGRIANGGAEYR